jgi:hypothetical protein
LNHLIGHALLLIRDQSLAADNTSLPSAEAVVLISIKAETCLAFNINRIGARAMADPVQKSSTLNDADVRGGLAA